MSNTVIQARIITSRETPEAICLQHPRHPLKFLHLPKSQVEQFWPVAGKRGFYDIEIPNWLAEKHDL